MEINSVGIVGLGALGVIYADYFTRKIGKENTVVFADAERIEKYEREGVFFNDQRCDFHYADAKKDTTVVDLLIFAVKYRALEQAVSEAKTHVGPNTIILSVLNGIKSEEDLRSAFGSRQVLDCVAQKMAARKEGNRADCTFIGELAIGDVTGQNREQLKKVIRFFDRTSFPYIVPENMVRQLWEKLMCNVGVNQTVMVYEGTYQTVQQAGKPRETMIAAMREVTAVANAKGIALDEKDVENWLNIIDHLNPDSAPSMRQDGKAKIPSEVELFAGTIVRLGKELHVPTPVNEWLYMRVKEIESKYK